MPLLEALGAAGAGWLAFELTDGIRAGRVAEELPQVLERARNQVREGSYDATSIQGGAPEFFPSYPIVGDEQIEWVMEYLSARLEETIRMLVDALEGLGEIVKEGSPSDAPAAEGMTASEVTLILYEEELSLSVDRQAAVTALEAIQRLKFALSGWRATTVGDQA